VSTAPAGKLLCPRHSRKLPRATQGWGRDIFPEIHTNLRPSHPAGEGIEAIERAGLGVVVAGPEVLFANSDVELLAAVEQTRRGLGWIKS